MIIPLYGREVERQPSSRQPVNQALNTQQIRGDYQTVIVPKGSRLSHRPGQAQSVREEGGMDGQTIQQSEEEVFVLIT